jgi:hypothetical protein
LIILDACRDNPFAGAFPDEWVPGLARPSGAPGNSLVAFATDPGNIASDGIGVHSPYTRALLRHIGRPGDSVEDFFKAVRKEVVANSDGFQTPWETSSLRAGLALRERAFLWGQIGGADDDAAVLVNGQQILDWNNDHGTRKQLLLEPGENDIVIQVFNQRSFTGGIPGIGGHLPEGWNYSVDLQMPDGTPFAHFHASEDQPEDNGPRHGKLFTVAHLKVSVEQITGRIVLLQRSELSLP